VIKILERNNLDLIIHEIEEQDEKDPILTAKRVIAECRLGQNLTDGDLILRDLRC